METIVGASQAASILRAARRPGSSTRSCITNGRKLLLTDERGATARRFRDLYHGFCQDLGGADRLSQGELQLVRRAAALSSELERQEAVWALGEAKFDFGGYATLTNVLRRVLESIGLERRAKDVTPPSLSAYLASRDSQGSSS
jgi:hypothetical protein